VERTEPLQHREHEALLAPRLWMRDLAAQHGEFLAQHKQLEVLRARRPAGEEQESEYLANGERDKADSHRPSLVARWTGVSVLVTRPRVMWHPSGDIAGQAFGERSGPDLPEAGAGVDRGAPGTGTMGGPVTGHPSAVHRSRRIWIQGSPSSQAS